MAMIGDVDDVLYAAFCEKLPSLEGKIIAITGCTTGTGYAAAEACAKKGAHVLMLNRKSERADAALAKVKAAAPGATVAHIDCDLTSIQSMKATAVAVKGAVGKLDVLANNAGIMAFGDIATSEGYDIQMATNHLSHFLLTKELMPLLEASASSGGDPRIVNHSSGARKRQHVLLRANLEKNGGNLGGSSHGFMMSGPRWKRYQQTKLANCCFTYELHDRLQAKGSKVKVLVCGPGVATTSLMNGTFSDGSSPGCLLSLAVPFLKKNMQSANDGSLPLLTCMCLQVNSGDFWEPCDEKKGYWKGPATKKEIEPHCKSESNKKLLWECSEAAIGEKWDA